MENIILFGLIFGIGAVLYFFIGRKKGGRDSQNFLDQAQKTIMDLEGSKREQQAQLKAEREKLEELKIQFEKQKIEKLDQINEWKKAHQQLRNQLDQAQKTIMDLEGSKREQ
ncbi:MAG: hypothetical protein OXM55_00830, partial [Bdellovibrionales bacterium]|nr:hypothetical protein [Bdellovibrionales bacterium]